MAVLLSGVVSDGLFRVALRVASSPQQVTTSATFTVKVIGGRLAPAAATAEVVHSRLATEQPQPLPEMDWTPETGYPLMDRDTAVVPVLSAVPALRTVTA